MCATQGCKGELTAVKMSTIGLGGAVSIKYNCSEISFKNRLYNTSDISMSVQVAFIVAGCIHTHTTYYKTLKHALGIDAVQWTTFHLMN